jgi:hypothetical protein
VPVVRIDPPAVGDEREMLRTLLDFHRATLAMKCDGLSDADLGRRSMPPSQLSLLGLVRHMAELHMINEYARHNGHADLLREGIDGTVGI